VKLTREPFQWKSRQSLLLVLLVAVGAWAAWPHLFPADPVAATSNGDGAPVTPAPTAVLPSALKLDALDPVAEAPSARRNPFRFGAPPPPPAPPRPAAEPVNRPVAPPPPPVPAGPPAIRLAFIGVMQLPNGQKIASLSDGGRLMLGREGDVIDGRFRIVRIGNESIVMEYLNGQGRQTIPLRGTL
jgi:hypothetical protein